MLKKVLNNLYSTEVTLCTTHRLALGVVAENPDLPGLSIADALFSHISYDHIVFVL